MNLHRHVKHLQGHIWSCHLHGGHPALLNRFDKTVKKKVMTKFGLPWPSRGYHELSCSHVDQVDRPLQELKA